MPGATEWLPLGGSDNEEGGRASARTWQRGGVCAHSGPRGPIEETFWVTPGNSESLDE
jgi:hypothetical protein